MYVNGVYFPMLADESHSDAALRRMEEGDRARGVATTGYPRRIKLSPFDQYFRRGFAITLGITLAVLIITTKGPNPYMKILCLIALSFAPVGIFESSFNDADDPPENRAEP